MSTVMPAGPSMAGQELVVRRESLLKNAVIIQRRLNYLTLGTIIGVAKGYADHVFVVAPRQDVRIGNLARSLGATVVTPESGSASPVEAILSSAGVIVTMYGDGTHDPYLLPELISRARNGSDVVIGSPPGGKQAARADYGFVATSYRALHGFKSGRISEISHQIVEHALRSGVKVRYLNTGADEPRLRLYRIGVVVPAYNEELLLGETVSGIPDYVSRIYVIDDCSTDRTPEVIQKLNDPRVVSLRHEVNKGVGASIVDGYKLALADDMDLVAVMAGDNQMDPTQLPKLLKPVIEGQAEYAKGNRLVNREFRKGMSGWRSFGNFLLTMITKIGSGYWNIMDPQNGYTVISRRALEALDLDGIYTYYGYCNDLLIKLNALDMKVEDVAIPARYGRERSKIKYSRFIRKVAPMIWRGFLWRLRTKYVAPDFHPLVLFYAAGMVLAPLGLLLSLLIPAVWFLIPGIGAAYAAVALILAIAGFQSLFFGMMQDRLELDRVNRAGAKYEG